MADAVFHEQDGLLVPTHLAHGPWDPRLQHGGAPSAALARAVERHEPDDALPVTRLTFELLRPVPLEPISVVARTVRPGRRVRLVEAEARIEGTAVARVLALQVRREPGVAPDVAVRAPALPEPSTLETSHDIPGEGEPGFGGGAMELRYVRGSFAERGPAAAWFRFRVPLVAGEEASPLQRVVAAADFGNGISATLDWDTHTFVNPDLTVYVARDPVGEWVALDSETGVAGHGIGLSASVLHDEQGPLGIAAQALFVDRRS
jgi:Acyl-CoA thioesterase C-terminal domain/Acyl-CoA thioesterase N-terminal domain